jgi:hypothetical protein
MTITIGRLKLSVEPMGLAIVVIGEERSIVPLEDLFYAIRGLYDNQKAKAETERIEFFLSNLAKEG